MKLKVTVNPNPFSSELIVFIHSYFTVNTVLRLISAAGTVIRTTGCAVNKGENKIEMYNLGKYATGHYLLEVKSLNGDLLHTIKLVKA